MDRPTALLQGLMIQMRQRAARIKKAVHATSVDVVGNAPTGEFSIVIVWKTKEGEEKKYSKLFNRQSVFGQTASLLPNAWSIQKKPCEITREMISEVLQQRGAL